MDKENPAFMFFIFIQARKEKLSVIKHFKENPAFLFLNKQGNKNLVLLNTIRNFI